MIQRYSRCLRGILVLLGFSLSVACQSNMPWLHHPLGPESQEGKLGVVVVKNFTCADPIISEAVQNVFLIEFADYAKEVMRDGVGDIVIEGTITINNDAAARSGALVWGGTAGGESKSQSGQYVTGVSVLIKQKERIVAGANESQSRSDRVSVVAPEALAQRAAEKLISELKRKKLLDW